MEPTLKENDWLICLKLCNKKWNTYFKMRKVSNAKSIIKRNDIVVFEGSQFKIFNLPNRIVKRCIGIPGDSIIVSKSEIYIKGKKIKLPKEYYEIRSNDKNKLNDIRSSVSSSKIISYDRSTRSFICNLESDEIDKLNKNNSIDVKRILFYDADRFKNWLQTNDTIIIPYKGMEVILNNRVLEIYQDLIYFEAKDNYINIVKSSDDSDNVERYIFKKNYYFMIGDNIDESIDSRFWGLLSEDLICAKVIVKFTLEK